MTRVVCHNFGYPAQTSSFTKYTFLQVKNSFQNICVWTVRFGLVECLLHTSNSIYKVIAAKMTNSEQAVRSQGTQPQMYPGYLLERGADACELVHCAPDSNSTGISKRKTIQNTPFQQHLIFSNTEKLWGGFHFLFLYNFFFTILFFSIEKFVFILLSIQIKNIF